MADIDELYKQTKVRITPTALPLETSRGCWWGQRNQCTFCGIDEVSMQYRRRSPEFVAPQLESLADQYGVTNFRFSDYIMPREYFRTLLPELDRRGSPFRLHWEMKSNMSVEEADILQRGGVFRAQLGVESFSTPILKMMRKGPLHAHYRYGIIFSEAFLLRTGFSVDDYCYVYQRPYEVAPDVRAACDVLVYQIAHWRREWDEGKRKTCTLQEADPINWHNEPGFPGISSTLR